MPRKSARKQTDVSIFISHAFKPDPSYYKIEEFRVAIRKAIGDACQLYELSSAGFSANPIIEMQSQAERLPGQVISNLQHCQFAIVDISGNNPNVFFEYGYLRARGVPCILLKSTNSATVPVPTDIQGEFINFYTEVQEIGEQITAEICKQVTSAIRKGTFEHELIPQVWFQESVENILVVSSSEHAKSEFAKRESPDHVVLDNIGDRDSVLACCMFLARRYPKAKITIHASDQFDYKYISHDIVVIGGPGDEKEGNAVCSRILREMSSSVSYDDEDNLHFGSTQFASESDPSIGVVKDYGYFARMPNPFDETRSVVLMHGIHTFGVLGAARAFTDSLVGEENMKTVMGKATRSAVGQFAFECIFEVNIFPTGDISVPRVQSNGVLGLKRLPKGS